MSRDALVIGINEYDNLNHLKKPANDAEAIAQLLETKGGFRVKRLPRVEPQGKLCIDDSGVVGFDELEDAIVQLFNPETDQLPETALLFFAGHGLRKVVAGIAESYLATSDVNPKRNHWGFSLQFLHNLLQKSKIKQQIVWLDCCYSGKLLNFENADPGDRGKGYARCFIAASREFEEAYESASSEHGVLTGILLQKLGADGTVDNYALTDFIQQNLKSSVQQPLTRNSGSRILLTHEPVDADKPELSGICPYKGLRFFDEEDAKYFYGRDSLTDKLIEKVRLGNFLAVLGVSGSGKSSVVRAGLLHQLKLGEKLGESRQWRICKPFTPHENEKSSLENLARVLVAEDLPDATWLKEFDSVKFFLEKGATGFQQWLDKVDAPRVLLVIDQFEEFFTRCELTERQQFFDCVLNCLPSIDAPVSKFCLIITMRADFLGKCAEQDYAGLTGYIDAHQVTITPMTEAELEAAINEPAKQVGLEIETELITTIFKEVEGPASLPLLQYTLTELWQYRKINCLTLADYVRLGGVQGTLQKSADRVYETLTTEEQSVAQWIFLELTQLGEGTEDTRKQILKTDLVTAQHSATLIDKVLNKLAKERLVVVDALGGRADKKKLVTVIDVAHEALIRHWEKLRRWLSEHRNALTRKREIDGAAKEWKAHKKAKYYLLKGPKLGTAEDYNKNYAEKVPLSNLTQEFVQKSIKYRQKRRYSLIGIVMAAILMLAGFSYYANEQRIQADQQKEAAKVAQSKAEKSEQAIKKQAEITLRDKLGTQSILATQFPNANNGYYEHALLLAVQAFKEKNTGITRSNLLRVLQAKDKPYLYLYGYQNNAVSLAFSPDDKILASAANDNTILLWNLNTGKQLDVLFDNDYTRYDSLVFSPDGKILASGSNDTTITFWDIGTRKVLGTPFRAENGLTNLAFSPDGNILASSSSNGNNSKVQLWNVKTRTLQGELLSGHSSSRIMPSTNFISLVFSPDGKTIATAGSQDNVIWLWNVDTKKQVAKLLADHVHGFNSITFSPDGNLLASKSVSNNVILWDVETSKIINPTHNDNAGFISIKNSMNNSMSFSADGNNLVFSDYHYVSWLYFDKRLLPFNNSLLLKNPNENFIAAAFSPYGNRFAYSINRTRKNDSSVKLFLSARKNLKKYYVLKSDNIFVERVVFSPDGKTLASVNNNNNDLILWDLNSRKIIGNLLNDDSNSIKSITFSPNGNKLVYGTSDGNIKLWDVETKKPIGNLLTHNSGYAVNSIIFSPDGKTIASGSEDSTVILWDVKTRKQLGKSLSDPSGPIYSLSYNPDGNILASGNGYGTIILWDVHKRKPIGELLTAHNFNAVKSLAFSPDGKTIASGNNNGLIKLWDFDTRKQLGKVLEGHDSAITNITFTPDGNTLVSGSSDTIILWNIDTLKPIYEGFFNENFLNNNYSLAFSPDSKIIALVGGEIKVFWDFKKIKTPYKGLLSQYININININYIFSKIDYIKNFINQFIIDSSQYGNTIAFVKGYGGNTVKLLDLETRQLLKKSLPDDSSIIKQVAFNPNGNLLVWSHQKNEGYPKDDYHCKLWNIDTREIYLKLTGYECVNPIAFSSDNKILVTSYASGNISSVKVWNIETNKFIGELNDVRNFTLSPDGKTIALSSDSYNGVKLWNIDTMKSISEPLASSQEIVLLAFSPDANILALANKNNNIILWNVKTGKAIGKPLFTHNNKIKRMIFSPDGKILASLDDSTANSNVILWDVETGTQLGEPFVVNAGFEGMYSIINFSPDGNTLIFIGSNGSVKLWDVNPKSWTKKACAIVNRNFSQEEWQKYMGNRPHEKTCPNLPKDTLGAIELTKQARKLVEDNKIEEAKAKLAQARKLDANVVFGNYRLE
jgi:WD40 repeat protein